MINFYKNCIFLSLSFKLSLALRSCISNWISFSYKIRQFYSAAAANVYETCLSGNVFFNAASWAYNIFFNLSDRRLFSA